jgi:hypothetical protein
MALAGKPLDVAVLSAGAAETIHTLHSELRTFGESFGCHEASFRLSSPAALLDKLAELSTAPPDERRRVGAAALPPSPRTISAHVVEALGDGRRVLVRSITHPEMTEPAVAP